MLQNAPFDAQDLMQRIANDLMDSYDEELELEIEDRNVDEAGDLVAILGAGAYGASMASTYNSRPLVAEVLADDGRYAVIRRRQTFDEMIAGEQPAKDWMTP